MKLVTLKCKSKKEFIETIEDEEKLMVGIEFNLIFENDVFFQPFSDSASVLLNHIHKKVADTFSLGESYDIMITPSLS